LAEAPQQDIAFRNVSKRYGDVLAATGIDLSVDKGAFIALLGPSGCGKTTCLRMVGGFEEPSEGQVFIRGQNMAGIPAHQRPVNMVFQHYALFPHFTVDQNIAYGLKQARPRFERAEITRRVGEALEMVQLGGLGGRRIHQLSGGQQQRVALARAIVNKPAVLLLDEPLAALDKKLRTEMQIELQNLQRSLGITFLLVTHDQEEALSMSSEVCVMNKGRIVQSGAPDAIYNNPADLFVAGFVGKSNFLDGVVEDASAKGAGAGQCAVKLANGQGIVVRKSQDLKHGQAVTLSLRPETLILRKQATLSPVLGNGTIKNRIFLGSTIEYAVEVPGLGMLIAVADHRGESDAILQPGENVSLDVSAGSAIAFIR
jgi:spermidine/putrescine transport system ATP-binding protein